MVFLDDFPWKRTFWKPNIFFLEPKIYGGLDASLMMFRI